MDQQLTIIKDKGYAWFAAFGMVLAMLFGLGISSFGNLPVLVYIWIDELGLTAQQAGLASSIISVIIFIPGGTWTLLAFLLERKKVDGPIYSLVIHAVGCWKSQMAASAFLLSGYIVVAYAHQLWHIIIGYSILTGLGAAIAQMASLVALEDFFHIHKDKVYTLTIAAYSAGLIAGPPFIEFLVRTLGYKLALLIESGIVTFTNLLAGLIYARVHLCFQCKTRKPSADTVKEANGEDSSSESHPLNNDNNNNTELSSPDKTLHEQVESGTIDNHENHSQSIKSRLLKSLQHQKEIIKSPAFIILLLHHIFLSVGEIICLTYVIELAVQLGFATPTQAALGPTLNGISSVITSIMMAVFAKYNKNPLALTTVFAFILASSIVSLPFSTYLPVYYVINFIFGIGEAGYITSIIFNLIQLYGETVTTVHRLAYVLMAVGVGFLLGPLIVGDAIRIHGSTDVAFYIGGGSGFIAGFCVLPLCIYVYLNALRTADNVPS